MEGAAPREPNLINRSTSLLQPSALVRPFGPHPCPPPCPARRALRPRPQTPPHCLPPSLPPTPVPQPPAPPGPAAPLWQQHGRGRHMRRRRLCVRHAPHAGRGGQPDICCARHGVVPGDLLGQVRRRLGSYLPALVHAGKAAGRGWVGGGWERTALGLPGRGGGHQAFAGTMTGKHELGCMPPIACMMHDAG